MIARSPARLVLVAVVVLAAAFALFHGPGAVTGRRLFFTHDLAGSDLWHLHVPLKHVYADALRHGRLPLWCPTIGTGFPLLAEGQVGALYPPNLALYGLLPLPLALDLSILLTVLLAGAFAALFARELGASAGGAVLAGVAFAFSGFMTAHLKHLNMVAAAAWIPLLLLAIERAAAGARAAALAVAAGTVALTILAGHPQIAYDNLLVAGIYALARLVRPCGARRLATAALLLAAVAGGVLLAAPQILPTYEMNRLGPRHGGLSWGEAFAYDPSPAALVALVAPKAFGDPGTLHPTTRIDPATHAPVVRFRGYVPPRGSRAPFWEIASYVGLLTLLFAAYALVATKPRARLIPLVTVLAVSLLLALGPYGGLALLFHAVLPGFAYFRFHGRFLLYVDLALAVLAGIGLTRIEGRLRGAPARLAAPLVIALTLLDLHHALGDQNPTIAARRWLEPPDTVRAIRAEAPRGVRPFRFADVDPDRFVFRNAYARARGWNGDLAPYDAAKRIVNSNLNALYDLDDVNFYFYIYPERLRLAALAAEEAGAKAASLFNVRFFLEVNRSGRPSAAALASFPGDAVAGRKGDRYTIDLVENPGVLPRAFLVPNARYLGDAPRNEERRLAPLRDPAFDPSRDVLIEGSRRTGDPAGTDAFPAPAKATITSYAPQRVVIDTEAPADAWLVLTDTYYPGWRATVDGRRVAIRPADVAVRAVPVPAGRHEVVFAYAPRSLSLGWGLAGLGLIGVAGLVVGERAWCRSRDSNPDRLKPTRS